MQINRIQCRVFSEDDDNKTVDKCLAEFLPFNLKKEKILLEENSAKGFNEKDIKIIQFYLKKKKHINILLSHILEKMTNDDKKMLVEQAETRLDNENRFFIRFDKTELFNGNLKVTDEGDCFHFTFSIATFPKSRDKALEFVINLFE